ncbi:uncharacterized protein LOC134819120 [Bolinopsis microptera]|uniref:uncharacterized protein LOC134819120 n=1 Tax=Bolinopsis microptera TaxID=2820187 RepID=UPI003078A93B
MVVGCPKGYQMRVDYAWTYQTYEQPNGNTLIEVNCSQLYALDDKQICFQGCPLPKLDNAVVSPLPFRSKAGAPYNEGEIVQVRCGEDTIVSSCRQSLWTNLSEYSCPKSNTSSRSLSLVIDTTTNMGEEITQVYDIAVGLVETVTKSEEERPVNYVLVPFNDPDFYPMLVTFNGTILLRHLGIINSHGASGGKDCPELTLAAIQRAIHESYSGSEIFVFTDASSKEPERKDAIIEEATQKRIKVNFILTGHCGENQMVDQAMYAEIADATNGFMVSVAKAQVREISSLMEGALMRNQDVVHQVIHVDDDDEYNVVQIPCDKRVHRMIVSVSCSSVRIVSVSDDKNNDIRYQHVSTLRDMMTISLQPSIAEYVNVNISCSERGSAVVTANTVTDISFSYNFFLHEVDDTLELTETLDSGSRAVVYVVFGAAVYDVVVSTVISNQPGEPVAMKKYLGGYMAELEVPDFIFHLQFQAKYSGQIIQRLSAPVVPRIGCQSLSTTTALPSTLLTKDRTVVSFTCNNVCAALSHTNDLVCNYGNWTKEPPHCSDAGYTCAELPGPGNGTLLYKNQVVYSVAGAKCGESVEVHCNTYFELDGETEANCTPYGWSNKKNVCIRKYLDENEVTRVLSEWWMWVVISVTAVVTLSVLSTVICILVIRRGKRKRPLRLEYETGRGNVRLPSERDALNLDEDLYEVVDSNGNYPNSCQYSTGCQPLCPTDSMIRNRPPMPPPLHSNSYGNLPNNMSSNPLYSCSRAGNTNVNGGGNDYMPMSGDIRSNSMIYEEMAAQTLTQPANVEDYNAYDYAIGHV